MVGRHGSGWSRHRAAARVAAGMAVFAAVLAGTGMAATGRSNPTGAGRVARRSAVSGLWTQRQLLPQNTAYPGPWQAVAAAGDGTIYLLSPTSVSPKGQPYGFGIYKVSPDGTETDVSAIRMPLATSMAVDRNGALYVAGGGENPNYLPSTVMKLTANGVTSVLPFHGIATTSPNETPRPTLLSNLLPISVAVDPAGNVYLLDSQSSRVLKLTPAGVQSTLAFTGLDQPKAIAVDATGTVYVADSGHLDVVALSPSGVQRTLPFGTLNLLNALAVDAKGDAFVADPQNGVMELTPSGTLTHLPSTGIDSPAGIAVDARGTVSVINNPVDVGYLFGGWVVQVPRDGSPHLLAINGLNDPTGVATDGVGDVFVSDPDPTGRWRVLERKRDGTLTVVGSTGFFYTTALAVDHEGNIYFAGSGSPSQVIRINPNGTQTVLPFVGLVSPAGIVVDHEGNVYVSDSVSPDDSFGTIRELTPAGVQTTLHLNGTNVIYGLAIDANDTIYAATSDRTVAELPRHGPEVDRATPGTGVYGVAVDAMGNLFTQGYPVNGLVPPGIFQVPKVGDPIRISDLAGGIAAGTQGHIFLTSGGPYETGGGLYELSGTPVTTPAEPPPVPTATGATPVAGRSSFTG